MTSPESGSAIAAAAAEATATAAAEAAAEVLPAVEPLTAGPAQPGSPHVVAAFAGAALADLAAPVPGRIAILVGQDLVDALADSPLGGLDLHAAVQPALEAVAGRLGSQVRDARTVSLDDLVAELAAPGGAFTTVPLIGVGIDAAVLVTDDALAGPPAGGSASDAAQPPAARVASASERIETIENTPAFTAPLDEQPRRPFTAISGHRGLEMLHGVDMEVTVELGRTRMTVRELLALSPGTVLELDRAAGSPADLLVNGRLIARGEVVVVDEDFGLRVTEILDDAAAV
ncbi:flagellar motor switch protein FliN/FliY [Nocardioides terrae]|uniref:Flagellar motor switch protein FliN/FliY n=1 Tax=Nocardioides terrae TaxID=574651 RepID=A0A1I1IA71_9ACTN|nr:flagellar motor switch protein FliN [Nocardioides terrae]SFC33146.1 flagellar motor switch protein FliN/FliY [Nocardioides terrae]